MKLMDVLFRIELTDLIPQIVIWGLLAVIFLTTFVSDAKDAGRRAVVGLLTSVAIAALAWFAMVVWPAPFPGEVTTTIFVAAVVPIYLVISTVLGGHHKILRIIFALLAAGLSYLVANQTYHQFETAASFFPPTNVVQMDYSDFESLSTSPLRYGNDVGALVTLPFVGEKSGFQARDAIAYVPPAYFKDSNLELPVVVLLAGNPGSPDQWFTAGQAVDTMDAYQNQHDGVSPIVISVDATGSLFGNPACVDGPEYKIQTYLTEDVPAMIKDKFRVNPDQSTWTIGGLSYGGTCALTTVTNSPESFGTFLDFSGEAEPNAGTRQETVDQFFGGNEQAFLAINPATILEKAHKDGDTKFDHIEGWFISGEQEPNEIVIQDHLAELATKAGMTVHTGVVPGAHSYETWRVAFAKTIDFAARRGGLK